jgi:DNA primase
MSGNSAELAKEKAKIYREQGLTVVAAFDNDRAGEQMAANLGYPRERLYPEGKDWNDDLKAVRPTAAERLERLSQEKEGRQKEAKRDRSGPSMSL